MGLRRLGTTGLQISPIGFGAWEVGGDRNVTGNLGAADDSESIAAIHRAIELGANWIDTAPGYGCGHSEEVVGRAIKGMGSRPYVFTKCGFVWGSDRRMINNIEPQSIRKEVDASLDRLGVDVIDLYQIHWVEPENDPLIEDAWATLAALKDEGKVAHIGVSNFDVSQLNRISRIAPVETLQPPYSLLERGIEAAILPYCAASRVGVIVYSPLQTGLLGGSFNRARAESLPAEDARRDDPNFLEPLLTRNLERVDKMRRLAVEWGTSVARIAVAWTLRQGPVSGAIVGFRRPEQVEGLLREPLPELHAHRLKEVEEIGWLETSSISEASDV